MRRSLVLVLVLALLATTAFLAVGCGEKKQTISTPEGNVTVTEDDEGTVTYESEEDDVTYDYSDKAPTEAELGAPIYPNSEYVPGSGGTITGSSEGEAFSTAGAEFTTQDGFEQVLAWYTDRIGQPMYNTDVDGTQEATWVVNPDEASVVTVVITAKGGGATISIGRMNGMLPTP